MGANQQVLSAASSGFLCDAADFDGTNDYALRGAGLTNGFDSKLFTLVFWIKRDTVTSDLFLTSTGSRFEVALDKNTAGGAGHLIVTGKNSAGTTVLLVDSNFDMSTNAHCFMVAVDLGQANVADRVIMYDGDTDVKGTVTTATLDGIIDFTAANWAVGADISGSNIMDASAAETWFIIGTRIDLTVVANRRLFYSSLGKPVNLGPAGAVPTGAVPDIYFSLNDGEAPANFVVNAGDGGNFVITGALTTSAWSPSD